MMHIHLDVKNARLGLRPRQLASTLCAMSFIAWFRIARRIPVALVLVLGGLFTVMFVFPRMGFPARDRTVARWSRWLLRACGVRLAEAATPGATPLSQLHGGTLIVANHISWLDIFLMLAMTSAHFVAKIEIANWPMIGRLVIGAGTLFIERGRRHAVHQLNERILDLLTGGRRIAVFPEGTTSDGKRVLAFHGNLLEPALRSNAAIIPVAIRYTDLDGHYDASIDFTDTVSLATSLKKVLGARGFIATLHPLPAITAATRQEAARLARAAIAVRLTLPMDDTASETLKRARQASREA